LIRYCIKKGDKTTSGAVVCEGDPANTHYGVPLSFLGARIYCPACKSSGVIVGMGPRLEDTSDKPAALSDDLGVCKCKPTPRLIASQYDTYEVCTQTDTVNNGYAPTGASLPSSHAPAAFDDRFVLRDQHGQPMSFTAYAIQRRTGDHEYGETDQSGHTHLLTSIATAEAVNIYIAG
jgi:uncharacterized Zn-binding protein involved in type VI secretion